MNVFHALLFFLYSVPYAHYNKADKIDRIAEWYDSPNASQGPSRPSATRAPRRDAGAGAAGAVVNNAFGYVHDEDEKSFSLVDNKSGAGLKPRGGGGLARGGARPGARTAQASGQRGQVQNQRNAQRTNQRGGRGGGGGGRPGWRDWNQVCCLVDLLRISEGG